MSDVEIQAREIRPRIEEALSRGRDEAERAMERETIRMSGYFQALSGDLQSVALAVDGFGHRETSVGKRGE